MIGQSPFVEGALAGGFFGDDAEVDEGDAIIRQENDITWMRVTEDEVCTHGGPQGFTAGDGDLSP